jgi:hypothetical protein
VGLAPLTCAMWLSRVCHPAFAHSANAGLGGRIGGGSPDARRLAARYAARLRALLVVAGGLSLMGLVNDQYRRVAAYVDRGAGKRHLPVAPTKYELVISQDRQGGSSTCRQPCCTCRRVITDQAARVHALAAATWPLVAQPTMPVTPSSSPGKRGSSARISPGPSDSGYAG